MSKYWIPITVWHFLKKLFAFIQYFLLRLLTARNSSYLQQRRNYRPPNEFFIIKNACRESLPLCNNYWVSIDINKASVSAFTVNVKNVSLQHKPSVAIETRQLNALDFILNEEADDVMLVCFYLSILCGLCYYQKLIKWIIVLEIYVTHDVISSNPVLFLYKSSTVNIFEHAKIAKR